MIQFTKPLYLLLLIPLVYWTWRLARQSLADMSGFRSKLALGLRLVIIIMLVFALAGARMVKNASQQCVVFVLDVSDSIPEAKQDAAVDYINSALKHRKKNQKVGVVVFGGEASVEFAPDALCRVDSIKSIPNTNNTDISQALGLALASFPEQCAKKIVLLSDGNETLGKSIEQAMLAGSNDVSIDTIPITNELPREALLDKMVCPNNVKIGEPFDLKVVAVSKKPTLANIRLLRNGAPVGSKTVELTKGKSIYTFKQSIPKAGNYEFRAVLETREDTRAENNTALAYTMVRGKPKVLYVEGQKGQEKYLSAALQSNEFEVESRDVSGVPNTMAQLQGYDLIVLSDVPAWNLAPEQMKMIQSGVKDLGIGFTMIGGENSFGAGGYFDTPIEKTLPVDMSVRKTKILPSLSVVIVMDKSGSMGAPEGGKTKIELANDAAAAVVKLMQPIDKVGIIVCHSYPVAAVGLRPATNKGQIYDQISTIRAEGGGIAVYPSMAMAYQMIKGSGTRQKHVILLADGSDCDEQDGVVPLVQKMNRDKITVTSVAIGDGPHVPFLKAVAYTGKGDYYLAQSALDLKAIFTKDVMTISKSLILEEPFTPRMDPSAPELSGVSMSVPPLLGYVATSAKSTARVSIASHKNDPILATWQYGLGKSAAFTSDCKARWSSRWLTWGDYNRFWAQVLRSTIRKSASQDFQTTVEITGGTGRVTIDAVNDKGEFLNMLRFGGSVVDPEMVSQPITIEQTGPGRYEASFDAHGVGTYVVNVGRKDQSDNSPEVSVLSVPYPPEYKDLTTNDALLRRIASETSGHFNPTAQYIFTRDFRQSKTYSDLWPLLVLLATLMLPIDVAVRRVALSPELIAELVGRVSESVQNRAGKRKSRQVESVETVGSLLQSKKTRAGTIQADSESIPDPGEPAVAADAVQPQKEKKVEWNIPAPTQTQRPPRVEKNKSEQMPKASDQPSSESGVTSRLLEAKKRAKEKKE